MQSTKTADLKKIRTKKLQEVLQFDLKDIDWFPFGYWRVLKARIISFTFIPIT